MAAAIGAGLPVDQPVGNMIVDIGGGTTEVAVISLFAVAHAESSRVAGDEASEAVMRHIQREHQMTISEGQAEELKIALGSAVPLPKPLTLDVTGKEAITGIPRRFTVTDAEIRAALAEPMALIVEMVRKAFERTPPELAADVSDRGLFLAGGGALVRGLDRLLSENLGVPVHVAEDPLGAVARGAGMVLENTRFYKQVFIN